MMLHEEITLAQADTESFKGSNLSEVVRRKRLDGQTLPGSVVDTARRPHCEFSNLQISPLTFIRISLLASHRIVLG